MELEKEIILPCGVKLSNRIAKSAMSENMSPRHHGPTQDLIRLYERWVRGAPSLLITGNIMIDRHAIAEPGNVLVEDRSDFKLLKAWAQVVQNTNVHLWPQINHPGRQAIGVINRKIVAPSAIKPKIKGMSAMFKKPRALTEIQIHSLIEKFGNTAAILQEAGFTGIQIHAAHGYLISQFLSPLSNQRKDQWGGVLENRARFLVEVYKNVRARVGPLFPIGIKINSADFQRGGFNENESMEVVKLLDALGVDLIEVSGGNYEKPVMTGAFVKQSTLDREAYFLDYVRKIRSQLKAPLMLTGGFRTVAMMDKAIAQDELDVVGLARPFALYPELPRQIFDENLKQIKTSSPKTGIKFLDNSGFVDIKWHEIQIHRLGKGMESNLKLSPFSVISHNLSSAFQKTIFGRSFKQGD